MLRLKGESFTRFTALSCLILGALFALFYFFELLPLKRQALQRELLNRAQTAFALSRKTLLQAIRTRDDVLLVEQIDALMKVEGVTGAYVLDNAGAVMLHNHPSQWGKVYGDESSRRALASRNVLVQETRSPKGYLFSGPLGPATLCIALSAQKADEMLASFQRRSLYTLAIAFLSAAFLLGLAAYHLFFLKVKKLEQGLASLVSYPGREIEGRGGDAWKRIERLLAALRETNEQDAALRSASIAGYRERAAAMLAPLAERSSCGIIIIDADNRVACMNGPAKEFLSTGGEEPVGRHVVDAVRRPELLALLRDFPRSPRGVFERELDGRMVRMTAVTARDGADAGVLVELL